MTNHVVVINLDATRRLFPVIYYWLDLESPMLRNIGVYNLHNLWQILEQSWKKQISINIKNTDPNKKLYIWRVATHNNGDMVGMYFKKEEELSTFFKTISIVFNITFRLNYIKGEAHETILINASDNNSNHQKIINIRAAADGQKFYEPWINPTSISHTDTVFHNANHTIH